MSPTNGRTSSARQIAIGVIVATAAVAVLAYDVRTKLTQTRVEFFETDELRHELNHLARALAIQRDSVLERVVSEGLATTFERDYGQISKPWSWVPGGRDEVGRPSARS